MRMLFAACMSWEWNQAADVEHPLFGRYRGSGSPGRAESDVIDLRLSDEL